MNTDESAWDRKSARLKEFMAELKQKGLHITSHFFPQGEMINATCTLNSGTNPIYRQRFAFRDPDATSAGVQRIALEGMLNYIADPENYQLTKLTPALLNEWRQVAKAQPPIGETYPIKVNPVSGKHYDPLAKPDRPDPLSSFGEKLEKSFAFIIKTNAEAAFKRYNKDYPPETRPTDPDFTSEEQLHNLIDQVTKAFKATNKPISSVTELMIFQALELSADGNTTIEEAVDQLINPPPFDPFNL
jgi:hypothetical protein